MDEIPRKHTMALTRPDHLEVLAPRCGGRRVDSSVSTQKVWSEGAEGRCEENNKPQHRTKIQVKWLNAEYEALKKPNSFPKFISGVFAV